VEIHLEVVLRKDPEHLGDGEDDLVVRDIQKERLPPPLTPFLKAFGMARGTKPAGAAGKHQEVFSMAVGTADAGESATGIAAVQVALDHLLDSGPEEAVLLLKTSLVFRQEPIEVMK